VKLLPLIVATGQSSQWPHSLGILCPSKTTSHQTLDTLLLRFSAIFRQSEILASNKSIPPREIRQLREYAVSLDEELATWPSSQPKEWILKTIGFVQQRNDRGLLKGPTS